MGNHFKYPSTGGVTIDDVNLAVMNLRGVANGVASLDINGKVPVSQLPEAVVGALKFKGTYNANTNTPALPSATNANLGFYYVVNVAGNGYAVGDWVINADGTAWVRLDAQDAVSSVAGKTGAVTLSASDITSGVFAPARLGSGTASASNFLRGDGSWQAVPSGGDFTWLVRNTDLIVDGNTMITDTQLSFNAPAWSHYVIHFGIFYHTRGRGSQWRAMIRTPMNDYANLSFTFPRATTMGSAGTPFFAVGSNDVNFSTDSSAISSANLAYQTGMVTVFTRMDAGTIALRVGQMTDDGDFCVLLNNSWIAYKKIV